MLTKRFREITQKKTVHIAFFVPPITVDRERERERAHSRKKNIFTTGLMHWYSINRIRSREHDEMRGRTNFFFISGFTIR